MLLKPDRTETQLAHRVQEVRRRRATACRPCRRRAATDAQRHDDKPDAEQHEANAELDAPSTDCARRVAPTTMPNRGASRMIDDRDSTLCSAPAVISVAEELRSVRSRREKVERRSGLLEPDQNIAAAKAEDEADDQPLALDLVARHERITTAKYATKSAETDVEDALGERRDRQARPTGSASPGRGEGDEDDRLPSRRIDRAGCGREPRGLTRVLLQLAGATQITLRPERVLHDREHHARRRRRRSRSASSPTWRLRAARRGSQQTSGAEERAQVDPHVEDREPGVAVRTPLPVEVAHDRADVAA